MREAKLFQGTPVQVIEEEAKSSTSTDTVSREEEIEDRSNKKTSTESNKEQWSVRKATITCSRARMLVIVTMVLAVTVTVTVCLVVVGMMVKNHKSKSSIEATTTGTAMEEGQNQDNVEDSSSSSSCIVDWNLIRERDRLGKSNGSNSWETLQKLVEDLYLSSGCYTDPATVPVPVVPTAPYECDYAREENMVCTPLGLNVTHLGLGGSPSQTCYDAEIVLILEQDGVIFADHLLDYCSRDRRRLSSLAVVDKRTQPELVASLVS